MNDRNNVIFGAIALAFIVYITVKGQLPGYAAIFKPKPKEQPKSSGILGSGVSLGDVGDAAKVAAKVAPYVI